MKKAKALYEDVVVGGEPPKAVKDIKQSSTKPEKKQKSTDKSNKNDLKSAGKDKKSQTSLEKRFERLSEDPYLSESEAKEGDTKEKSVQSESDGKTPKEELDILASRAEKTLFQAKAIFPFDFFPDSIRIDANKVDFIIKTFFLTETITSVLLKEIMDVRVEAALFFGKLIIDYGPHPLKINTIYIGNLWKKDALRAKEIIEGVLVLYRSENVNTTELKPEETLEEIKTVGKAEEAGK